VKDLDRQVITSFPDKFPCFLLENDSGSMVRVDNVIALLERALLDRSQLYLELYRVLRS